MTDNSEGWSQETAIGIAERVARKLGIASRPVLLRLGTHAVFLLDTGSEKQIMRVSPPDYSLENLEDQIRLAFWLADRGFLTSRPLWPQPSVEGNSFITLWEWIESDPTKKPLSPVQAGRFLRAFHEVTDTYDGQLPEWEPLGRMGDRLDSEVVRDRFCEAGLDSLLEARNRLVTDVKQIDFELKPGPQHGDFHRGNILRTDHGPALIDFDRIAFGPREWDLTQFFASRRLFDERKLSDDGSAELDGFAAGYGWDLRNLPGIDVLIDLRALFMISWLLTLPSTPRTNREITRRLLYFTDRDNAPRWSSV